MAAAGRACLILALGIALYGVVASLYGARRRDRRWIDSGRRSVYALSFVVTVAFVLVEAAFLRSDFSYALVAGHSSTTTPTFYRATAMWSSQEGSLLLWVFLLALWSSVILFASRKRLREVAPYATAVLLGFAAFFTALLVFLESPFDALAAVPAEGAGLNPLLRHPSMMIHPPMLYSGYTLFTIPFAFAVGALITRQTGADWIRTTRPFTLAAWFFLGIGIVLGARWSYTELGWGGYWAWDPVENASLMPWLTGTAFLHSVMIQEKRGMLKVWNASLVLATGVLAILGTFLVRSGILDSIHAFGASTLGIPFLVLIVSLIAGSAYLVLTRLSALRSEHHLDSLLSREAIFLLNNLVLVGLCFVIFWGTFFPLIAEAVTGTKASVGPPWFDRYIVPLALMLVLLSGIGPVIAWRRATASNLRRNLLAPGLFAVAVAAAAALLGSAGDKPAALGMFAFGAFVVGVTAQEFKRGIVARRAMSNDSWPAAAVQLVRRNRRRYGGYLVHVGVALLFVGVAASSAFQHAKDVRLAVGQSTRVGDYTVRYERPTGKLIAARNGRLERIDLGARLGIFKDGKRDRTLTTVRAYFPSQDPSLGPVGRYFEGEPTTEVGLHAGLTRDLWTAVSPDAAAVGMRVARAQKYFLAHGRDPKLLPTVLDAIASSYVQNPIPATFRVIDSPMVTWIWLGALVVFLGGLIALWPQPRVERAAYAARVAGELGRA